MKNDFMHLISCLFLVILISGCTESTDKENGKKTHSVAFRTTASTNTQLTGISIGYDITDGTRVRDLFVKCSNMPWQSSTYENIDGGMGVGISILVNNGPSYGGTGNLTIFIIVDNAVWKSSTINMTTGASASLGGTLPE